MASKQDKVNQLEAVAVKPTEKSRITADFGTKQTNTDDWLRVSTDKSTGPMLLEDAFGREKVRSSFHMLRLNHTYTVRRFIDLTMNEFLSV